MEKLLFFGDSITDMGRNRDSSDATQYGMSYVFLLATLLKEKFPHKYEIINKGIGGNTVLDLYERYEQDVIPYNPDVLTIFIGVNDVWHRISKNTSKASNLFEFIKLYEQLIIDIKNKLPNTKIIICEPYVCHGTATDSKFEEFLEVYKYAKYIKKLSNKYRIPFIRLQSKLNNGQEKYGSDCLFDGVHPNVVGASIIAKEWLKCYKKMYNN